MKHIFCYNSFVLFCNPKTQTKKGLILYNTTNGITSLKKCEGKLFYYYKNVWKWSEQSIERRIGKTNCKKRSNLASSAIVNVFAAKNLSQNIICKKNKILRIWAYWLLEIISPYNLCKIYGWSTYVYICA